MKPFDWVPFLTKHRIPFITKGANVKRGEISAKCPWCGNADPSFHLGLNLENGYFSCWRNRSAHSGKSPVRLVMKLLNLPYWKAREVCGLEESFVDPEGFDAAAARIMGREPLMTRVQQVKRQFLDLDQRFLGIDDTMRTRRWWNYLYTRGFDDKDIAELCRLYTLRADRNSLRLIIPFFLDSKLVTWTGRAIAPSKTRYLDLSVNESLVPAKETLYNHDCIAEGGKVLVVVEGPLDTLKVDFYGRPFGVRAVGLATNSLTEAQTFMLDAAISKFEYIGVMLDNSGHVGTADSLRMRNSLLFMPDVRVLGVPYGRKDAGECLPRELKTWAYELTKGMK